MLENDTHSVSVQGWTEVLSAEQVSPIVMSVPHDGLSKPEFADLYNRRMTGHTGKDKHVWPFVWDIVKTCKASAVHGLMHRAYIDYNRAWPVGIKYDDSPEEPHTALDDPKLVPAYKYYHEQITRLLNLAIASHHKEAVLLLDMHGFTNQPPYAPKNGYDVILGTGNRKTIPYNEPDRRLARSLEKRGYCVFLPEIHQQAEEYYSADHTTHFHSKNSEVNAIQIEISIRFRTMPGKTLGQQLAKDLGEILQEMIP